MASLRKLKGKWYVRIFYCGKEKIIPTYTAIKRDAEIVLRRYQENEQEVKLRLADHLLESRVTIDICIKYFNANYQTERSIQDSTCKIYRLALNDFKDCFESTKEIYKITKRDYPILIEYLKSKYSVTTCNIRLRAIRSFLNYLDEKDFIKALPFSIKQIRIDQTPPKMIKPSDLKKIYQNIGDHKLLSAFKVLEVTGMRVGEIKNSHRDGDFIIVEKSKNRRQRFIPIPNEYIQDYDIARDVNYSDGWLSHSFSKASKLAGLEGKTAHCLRHTFAYRMLLETDNIQLVRDMLGHSSTKVTEIYTQIPTEYLKQVFTNKGINIKTTYIDAGNA
ncbi:MAG: tyrosine-type recombinase/integrase [Candidatus Marinimicrobia bacterium]|nr:tyrosine-type recombinase/integrase [Candidatus Neomarinimicrobiota bacterium]